MTLVRYGVRPKRNSTLKRQSPPRFRMEVELPGWDEATEGLVSQPGVWGRVYDGPDSSDVRRWITEARLRLPGGIWQIKRIDRTHDTWGRLLPDYDAGIYARFVAPLTWPGRWGGQCDVVLMSPFSDVRQVQLIDYGDDERPAGSRSARATNADHFYDLWQRLWLLGNDD